MTAVLAASLLPLLMMIAGIGDFLTYKIPNWLTGLIAVSFIPMALLTAMPLETVALHVAAGVGLLIVGFGLFAGGLVGGGDAKLMAAAGLWFGWPASMFFLAYTALAGGVLAIAVALWAATQVDQEMRGHSWIARWRGIKPDVPYGVALAVGAILAMPNSWWMHIAG
jgi:prepilin peptidase CpaA